MKRPEGFDPPGRDAAATPSRRARPVRPAAAAKRPATPPAAPTRATPIPSAPASPSSPSSPASGPPGAAPRASAPRSAVPPRPQGSAAARPPRADPASRAPRGGGPSRAEVRADARARRRAERAEVKRFTRRARNRRLALAAVAGTILTLVGLILTAIYSPVLSLRTVVVDGTARVDAVEVAAAVEEQLGTPLALLDYDRITTNLGAFPLIRSYVTEIVPPDTLLVHISERQPVGSIEVGGTFRLVDPAGITLEESAERLAGVPLIELAEADTGSAAFRSMVEVLLSLPAGLLAQVDRISAHTQDDVVLVLNGVGQQVRWGSADESERKAVLLAALIGVTDPSLAGVFDVSAPTNGIFRPA